MIRKKRNNFQKFIGRNALSLAVYFFCLAVLQVFNSTLFASDNCSSDKSHSYVLWYNKPAVEWVEALPIGNGRLGGMVFGNPSVERLQLNEESLWGGSKFPNNNPGALKHLSEIRHLILDGKIPEAFELSEKYIAGIPGKLRSYQVLGDIYFNFTDTLGETTNYRRELNLETGIARVSYTRNKKKYRIRNIFILT